MSQYSQSSTTSFEEYTTGLRNGLREAARIGLSQLEEMINDVGYGWLDGYMDSIMESSSSKAPIADLMKTPSRTQKSRTTRAKTATAKSRSKKALKESQAFGKSVSAPSPLARQALSPLNPSTINTPPLAVSPSKGKSKASKSAKPKEKKVKEKVVNSKKSRRKKADEAEEAFGPEPGIEPEPEPGVDDVVMVDEDDGRNASEPTHPQPEMIAVDQHPEVPEEPISAPSRAKSASQRSAPSQVSKSIIPVTESSAVGDASEPPAQEHAVVIPVSTRNDDVAQQRENSEEETNTEDKTVAPVEEPEADIADATSGLLSAKTDAEDLDAAEMDQKDAPAVTTVESDLEMELPDPLVSSPPLPASLAENNTLPFQFPDFKVAPTPAPRQPDPVRQVRSSWLSKALGRDTVPVNGPVPSSSTDPSNIRRSIIDATSRRSVMAPEGLRKSVVAPRERVSTLPTAPIDFAAARKSLVQPGQLGTKRKSEILEEQSEPSGGDQSRPEKISKPNSTAPVPSVAAGSAPPVDAPPKPESLFSPAEVQPRRITPFGRPKVSTTSTQAFPLPSTTPHHPTQTNLSSAHRDTTQSRTDIDKVNRRLDELRAAQEASKAKLAASGTKVSFDSRASTAHSQPTASGGFFRGLGSLGRSLGLGGNAKSAEDEALRLQRELEEEKMAEKEAEAELKRLMDEVAAEEAPKAETMPIDETIPSQKETQDIEMEDNTDEEDADSVNADLTVEMEDPPVVEEPEPKPAAPAKTTTPARKPPIAASTTPTVPPPPSMPSILQRLGSNAEPVQRDTRQATRHEDALSSKSVPVTKSPRAQQAENKPSSRPPSAQSPRSPASRSASRLAQAAAPPRPVKSPERAKRVPHAAPTSPTSSKSPKSLRTNVTSPARKPVPQAVAVAAPVAAKDASKASKREDRDEEDSESEPEVDLPDLPEPSERADHSDVDMDDEPPKAEREVPAAKMFKETNSGQDGAKIKKSTSSQSIAPSLATSTASSSNMLSHASTIAGKTLGFKPTTGPVKSIALAAAAAKKEQAALDRKTQFRAEAEQRKALAAQKKAEEDKQRIEEEKRARAAELEEKRRHRAALEKQRKEREEKVAAIAEEKAKRKAEEAAAAAKIKAEQEANRKRKLLQAGQKPGMPPAKKPAPGLSTATPAPSTATLPTKNMTHEPLRIIKPSVALPSSSSTLGPAQKAGPTHFRSASSSNPDTGLPPSSSTISVVQPGVERQPIGPPARPSTQIGPPQHGAHPEQPPSRVASVVLQQSRIALQAQIDIKALEKESEDIELPDIASEYSDSEDEDKSTDFIRPTWAESPELRHALQKQAYRDPDELFGPIKAVNMEELFKARPGKFRARSSSANWVSTGDRLTKGEEVEYARRMGFKPIAPGARAGSSIGPAAKGARSSQA